MWFLIRLYKKLSLLIVISIFIFTLIVGRCIWMRFDTNTLCCKLLKNDSENAIPVINSPIYYSDCKLNFSVNDYSSYQNILNINWKSKSVIDTHIKGNILLREVSSSDSSNITAFVKDNNFHLFINIISSIIGTILLGAALFLMMKSKNIQQQLDKSEQQYRLISENAKDIIYRMQIPDGQYEYISPTCQLLTGYSPEDFYNTPKFLRTILDPEFIHIYDTNWNEVLKGKSTPTYEYKIINKNEHRFWLEQKNTIIFDQNGCPIALEGVITDITIKKNNEIEREKLIKELEEKNIDLERFIYIISHELKTPLITIKGFLGYLEEEAMKGDLIQLHQDIVRIITATETMQRQLNNLIDINRIGRNRSEKTILNTREMINSIIERFGPLIDENKIYINIGKLPAIKGYENEITELFQILIENAIKFSLNQKDPAVQISTTKIDNDEIFFIKDNGIGIDKRYVDRIFGLFNKLDPHTEGTGAGLAIAKRVVEHHGGWIRVESEGACKGSTFFLKLPLA